MKRALLILCLVTSCFGQGLTLRSPLRDGVRPAAASSLLIDENFESTGKPSPWDSNAGVPDWDNTSSPIAGAQDVKMGSAATCNIYAPLTPSSEMWVQFEMSLGNVPGSITIFGYLFDGPFAGSAEITVTGTGNLKIGDGGGTSSATTDAMTAGVHYWVFFHALKGTGANAAYDVEFSTTSTRVGSGNKFQSYASGTLAANVEWVYFDRQNVAWGSGITYQLDNVKISNTGWPP
jgi:hypothetical protein